MNWQKRARIGVAVFGLASAVVVYRTMGARVTPAAPATVTRIDPKAVIESQGTVLQQVQGTKQNYLVEAEQQLVYEGGATKLVGVKISVRNRGGRDFVITAREAEATENHEELHLSGAVGLKASDGFEITTKEAYFRESDGHVRAPEAFEFTRGRMVGTGTGMVYQRDEDILSIEKGADVRLLDASDNTLTRFVAGAAIFVRPEHRLELSGTVHVLHNDQVIDAETTTAHLTDDDSHVQTIALRGHSEVSGSGQGLDRMNADDMDLTYAEDGETLQHVLLIGSGRVAMSKTDGSPGRTIAGDSLDILLGPDGALTRLSGQGNVRLELAAATGTAARHVTAQSLDGLGESGQGLTSVEFRGAVEYREDALGVTPGRVVRSRALRAGMADDAIQSAVFTGGVRFSDQGLQATGGEATYAPAQGTLRLRGGLEQARPRVADEQVTVDGGTIDVALEGRTITAAGGVKTTLTPAPARTSAGQPAEAGTRLPGLLKAQQPANVNAEAVTYEGENGKAVYTGGATLFQGETAVRADEIALDQKRGDLTATGDARSTIVLDGGSSVGRAHSITYIDATRLITYEGSPAKIGGPPRVPAQVSGPQGDLRADRIEIVLAQTGNTAERLEAYSNVDLTVAARKATGARLTYFSADDRYLMTGVPPAHVKVVEQCRETIGKTLIFFKSTDRIIVDGNEEIRTQTTNGGACTQPPTRAR